MREDATGCEGRGGKGDESEGEGPARGGRECKEGTLEAEEEDGEERRRHA